MFATRHQMTFSKENLVAIHCLYQLSIEFVQFSLKLPRQTDDLYSKKSYKMLLEMHRAWYNNMGVTCKVNFMLLRV